MIDKYSGKFIIFEGGEGGGKGTFSKYLYEKLKEKYPGKDIILTRDPGGTPTALKIREICVNDETISRPSELLLYLAARMEIVEKVIIPNLKLGNIVISDRFCDSTYVYQGIMRKLGINIVDELHRLFNIPIPDITIYMDVDPMIGLARKHKDNEIQKFEKMDMSVHETLRNGFLYLYDDLKIRDNIIKINTDSGYTPDKILLLQQQLFNQVVEKLND